MQRAQQELLVLEAQSGDERALECLVALLHPLLVKFAVSISGNHALAKDAVQDVWLHIAKTLRQLDDPRAFKSWMYRAVRWRVIDLARSRAAQFESLDGNETEAASVALDESDLEQAQLRRSIDQLRQQEREVIYLYYLGELSIAEAALVLDIPQGTVKSRLSRARKQLHQLLEH